MTTLGTSPAGELSLTLRGAEEDRILTALRRWPHWLRAQVERDPDDPERCLSVTLVADRVHEPTVREILKRSFGIVFPAEGGTIEITLPPPPPPRRRGWHR